MNTISKYTNKNVLVIDALGKHHKGTIVGVSSVNKNNALLKISKNKIMEISGTRIIKVL